MSPRPLSRGTSHYVRALTCLRVLGWRNKQLCALRGRTIAGNQSHTVALRPSLGWTGLVRRAVPGYLYTKRVFCVCVQIPISLLYRRTGNLLSQFVFRKTRLKLVLTRQGLQRSSGIHLFKLQWSGWPSRVKYACM